MARRPRPVLVLPCVTLWGRQSRVAGSLVSPGAGALEAAGKACLIGHGNPRLCSGGDTLGTASRTIRGPTGLFPGLPAGESGACPPTGRVLSLPARCQRPALRGRERVRRVREAPGRALPAEGVPAGAHLHRGPAAAGGREREAGGCGRARASLSLQLAPLGRKLRRLGVPARGSRSSAVSPVASQRSRFGTRQRAWLGHFPRVRWLVPGVGQSAPDPLGRLC